MEIQYVHVKPRSQFGKQCFFDDKGPCVEENILPEPEYGKEYIDRLYVDRAVQKAAQIAVHEMQTFGVTSENRGMFHAEGGWPKEVNPKDPEATQRIRRRAEKDDNWAPVMRNLVKPAERCVLQNNAINIHENYFDDMISTDLVLSYEARKINLFVDPQTIKRPVNHLSWLSDDRNRLVASYCFMEFESRTPEASTVSYVWDIENPHEPIMTLRPLSPAMSIEFNPHDGCLLVGGLMSGQVCYWDTRIADKPVEMSHGRFSHRQPANRALWTSSKTNTEFFSSSCDGLIKWWDLRALKKPTETLVMDLEDPSRSDRVRAIGVSALQFEPTMGAKCMAGLENGILVDINRKGQSIGEKLATRFECHKCPVLSVDRNPFSLKYFLTVGYWTVKLWAEDVRENDLASIVSLGTFFTGGCWSRARFSVFFIIDRKGILSVYDLLNGIGKPITAIKICNDSLTTIEPHSNGTLLAIGSEGGNIFLVKCLEGLTTTTKTEKTLVSAYFERSGHFEKLIDNRLKEFRLVTLERSGFDAAPAKESTPRLSVSRSKGRAEDKRESPDKSSSAKKKLKPKKSAKSLSAAADIIEAEKKYFEAINAETEKYAKAREAFGSGSRDRPTGTSARKRKVPKAQTSKKVSKTAEKSEPLKKPAEIIEPPARPVRYKKIEPEISLKEEEEDEDEVEEGEMKISKKGKRIFRKICPPWIVCKPEICCKDLKESLSPGKPIREKLTKRGKEVRRLQGERRRSSSVTAQSRTTKDKYFEEIMSAMEKIPERTTIGKLVILRKMREPLSGVLRDQAKRARQELDDWRKTTGYGRYNLRKVLDRPATEEAKRKSLSETEETTYGISSDIECLSTKNSTVDGRSNVSNVSNVSDVSDDTTVGILLSESFEKTDETLGETSTLNVDEVGETREKGKIEDSRKKLYPCDFRARSPPIEEIVKSSGVELRDPSSLMAGPPETGDKPLFKRKEDYPRISAARTHRPSKESLL